MAVSRNFIADKLKELVPNINTSVGSRADTILITPLVELFSGFDEDEFTSFLTTRIQEYNSNLAVSQGTANYDILVSVLSTIIEPLWWEIKTIKNWQSLENYLSMPDEEMDALVANYFVTRSAGSKSRGTVRVYFSKPTTAYFSPAITFTTRSGLVFIPVNNSSIQADLMALNQESGQYFVDIIVEAADYGTEYNILSGQIVSVSGLSAAYSRVTNRAAFSGGKAQETNGELYQRALNSLTVRNLVTKKGIKYNLQTEFPRVEDIEVIGFGDNDMDRDLIPYGYTTTTTITQLLSGGSPTTIGTQTVTGANYVHVGGKVDIYAYTGDLTEGYVDITNINPSYSISLSQLPPYSITTPLIRIKQIERLDPLYLTQTGQYIPCQDPIDIRILRDMSFSRDENTIERSVGTARVLFEWPTSFEVTSSTVFTAENGQQFIPLHTQSITASGMSINSGQAITKSAMESNVIYTNNIVYYYVDISIKSVNAGDDSALLNEGDYLTIANYTSEGWRLRTSDENYSFSTSEVLVLSFSSTFNDGISTGGESIRIIYEHAPTVREAQEYVETDEERVVTSDLLVKHFQPAYVDLALTFEGAALSVDDAEIYIRNFINSLSPGEYLEISDLISMLYEYGATRVVTPIDIFILILEKDRTYTAVRFDDRYRTNKRIHFIARNISLIKR